MNSSIGYTCSYVPREIIYAAGFTPRRIEGRTDVCHHIDGELSGNICPYAHAVLKSVRDAGPDLKAVIMTDSCDGMKKLADVLRLDGFPVIPLSVPRSDRPGAVAFYARQLAAMYEKLLERKSGNVRHSSGTDSRMHLERTVRDFEHAGKVLQDLRLQVPGIPRSRMFLLRRQTADVSPGEILDTVKATTVEFRSDTAGESAADGNPRIPVAILGSPMPNADYLSIIEDAGLEIVENDSCLDGRASRALPDEAVGKGSDIFTVLARSYLSKIPCARMKERNRRLDTLIADYPGKIRGFILFRMPFCDLYGFDLVYLLRRTGKGAVLQIETDGSERSEGQVKTRIQAFAETLAGTGGSGMKKHRKKTAGEYSCGIDIGSTTIDGVILNRSGETAALDIIRTGPGADSAAVKLVEDLCKKAGIKRDEIGYIMATGYGRESAGFADGTVTEITCHARGALHLVPDTAFIIDIGGQDSKIIRLDESGKVKDFQMNDKCAAGTGRFLEVMARALEIDLEGMTEYAHKTGEAVLISSVCTVFAESEVISLLGKGYSIPGIVKGLYNAIANRIEGMVKRVGLVSPVTMTGGGALNRGLVEVLENRLGVTLVSPPVPQSVGAVGAALLGAEQLGAVTTEGVSD